MRVKLQRKQNYKLLIYAAMPSQPRLIKDRRSGNEKYYTEKKDLSAFHKPGCLLLSSGGEEKILTHPLEL